MVKIHTTSIAFLAVTTILLGCGKSEAFGASANGNLASKVLDANGRPTVLGFSIHDISPGMDVQKACESLTERYPEKSELNALMGVAPESDEYEFRDVRPIMKGHKYSSGCSGKFTAWDKTITKGSLVKAISNEINVSQENGDVYQISTSQKLIVGRTREDCLSQQENVLTQLISKYGKPTKVTDTSSYINYHWDYSLPVTVDDITTEYGREEYFVNTSCELSEAAYLFVHMRYFSGEAKRRARQNLQAKKYFQPDI